MYSDETRTYFLGEIPNSKFQIPKFQKQINQKYKRPIRQWVDRFVRTLAEFEVGIYLPMFFEVFLWTLLCACI
jgi:hypothetical protein